jgi:hypothetical protein
MALSDLTGIYRNKKFEGGVGGGAQQTSYGGPEPVEGGEDASADTLHAAVMGIYEKYGRSAKGIRMAKASPEYAALKGAGISVFGTPTATIGQDGKLTGGTMSISGASEEMKKKAASQYAALEGGSRGRTARTAASAISDAITSGAEVTPPNPIQNKPRVPESTAQTAQSTSMSAVNPPATPATDTPKVESATKPNVVETTKGPRLNTSTTRDYLNTRGQTNQQGVDSAYNSKGGGRDQMNANMNERDQIYRETADETDAGKKMARGAALEQLRAEREGIQKDYNAKSAAADRKDRLANKMAGWQSEKGDSQIAMQTGEVQDRSMFGGTKVSGRETYKGPGGKEFVGNRTSEGFIGLPSKSQNQADTYNKGMQEVPVDDRRSELTGERSTATFNKYEIDGKGGGFLGQGSKEDYKVDAGGIAGVKDQLPSAQKDRFSKDVTRFTTGTDTPAEGSNLTAEEFKKKKTAQYNGPIPKA